MENKRRLKYRLWVPRNRKKWFKVFWAFQNVNTTYNILNIWTILPFLINWNLDNFLKISGNFKSLKMVDHILEIPRLLNVEWFNSDNTRIVIIPGGTKTTIKSIFNSYVFSPHINHACILVLDNIKKLFGHIYTRWRAQRFPWKRK